MPMVCPQCSELHEQLTPCPQCGPRLQPRGPRAPAAVREGATRWQQTAWGRVLIGLLLAQGLFYGLRQLLTGAMLAASGAEGAEAAWTTEHGTWLLQGIQFLTLLLGGLLAGVGQRYGVVLGAVVGAWNGVLAVLLNQGPTHDLAPAALTALPGLHATFAAVGGWLGGLIWRPLPAPVVPGALVSARKAAAQRRLSLFAGPVGWFRVALGAALAIAGTLTAEMLFEKVLSYGGGKLGTSTELQDRIIIWEIKALAVLLGSALAGATTPNGFKQGLFVGLFSSFVLVGLESHGSPRWFEIAALTFVSSFSLALAGGWFGGQLFPPVFKVPRRSATGIMDSP